MSDEEDQDAARDAAAGDGHAQAAVLLSMARSGRLDQARILAMQACGFGPALDAFPCRHDDVQDGDRACACWYAERWGEPAWWTVDGLARWSRVLTPMGHEAQVVAATAGAQSLLSSWKASGGDRSVVDAAAQVILAADAWVAVPAAIAKPEGIMAGRAVVTGQLAARSEAMAEKCSGTRRAHGRTLAEEAFDLWGVVRGDVPAGVVLLAQHRFARNLGSATSLAALMTFLDPARSAMVPPDAAQAHRDAIRHALLGWALR